MPHGLLAIWTDVPTDREDDFNAWYDHEHLLERATRSGFMNGRRYCALAGNPRYLALYDTATLEALFGGLYYKRLNDPTPWTQRVIPTFVNTIRATFSVRAHCGHGCGGVATTLRFALPENRAEEFAEWMEEEALSTLGELPGIITAKLLQPIADGQTSASAEGKLRAGWNSTMPWAILIEASSAVAARTACRVAALSTATLREHGASAVRTGYYRLLWGLGDFTPQR
ncbi:MAG: DUF4286 family protein [Gammaproteobacteria bacterium]